MVGCSAQSSDRTLSRLCAGAGSHVTVCVFRAIPAQPAAVGSSASARVFVRAGRDGTDGGRCRRGMISAGGALLPAQVTLNHPRKQPLHRQHGQFRVAVEFQVDAVPFLLRERGSDTSANPCRRLCAGYAHPIMVDDARAGPSPGTRVGGQAISLEAEGGAGERFGYQAHAESRRRNLPPLRSAPHRATYNMQHTIYTIQRGA